LGPLDTADTIRPIVPDPGDYDDGEICGIMTGRGNQNIRGKPKYSEETRPSALCPPQTPHAAPTQIRAAAVRSQRLTA
jgi:hypothetical protein